MADQMDSVAFSTRCTVDEDWRVDHFKGLHGADGQGPIEVELVRVLETLTQFTRLLMATTAPVRTGPKTATI